MDLLHSTAAAEQCPRPGPLLQGQGECDRAPTTTSPMSEYVRGQQVPTQTRSRSRQSPDFSLRAT